MAYIRKLASGNLQVQIRLKGLKPISRSFSTKTKAKEFAREIEGNSELARKMGVSTAQIIIFSQLVDIYLKQYTGKDPSIFGRLKFWVDRFGEKSGTTIDEFMVNDGLVYLAKNINIVTPVESGLSR